MCKKPSYYACIKQYMYPGGGGGGHSQNILVGVCRSTSKKGGGVLGTGTIQKEGVLGTGTTHKRGGLRHGNESKKGGFKNSSCKKDNLSKWCCTKGGFGSLFINYPYFFLVNMINWWGFTLTDKKRGVLGTGQVKKGGYLLRHTGVCTGHICECPPPPDMYIVYATIFNPP